MTEPLTSVAARGAPGSDRGLRAMMRRFPTGVAVVTTLDGSDAPRGMTVSSLCSVSLDPPTLLVCLRVGSPTLDAILTSGRFAVNLLHGDASAVADLFASGEPDRFERVYWEHDPTCPEAAGPHLRHDAYAIADCRATRAERLGDHVVVFGEALRVTERPECSPLVYGQRQYRPWPG
jgi:flavin reductase (DIM6/NTAB) family NADH-FMN oxidoreductase RutF